LAAKIDEGVGFSNRGEETKFRLGYFSRKSIEGRVYRLVIQLVLGTALVGKLRET
jgi:hypothetical protein